MSLHVTKPSAAPAASNATKPSIPIATSSSRPGTGAERVVALLRLYTRMALQPMDVLLMDALLVGPFSFGRKEGGASVLQLSKHLGVAPKLILDALKGGPLGPASGIIVSTASFKDNKKESESDEDSDDAPDEDDKGDLSLRMRRLENIRYFVNFTAAVPYAITHISKAVMALLKRPSDGSLEIVEEGTAQQPSTVSSSVMAALHVGGGDGGGSRRWHCFNCQQWLPQGPTKAIVATCYCSVCGGNLIFMASAEARNCFETIRAAKAAAAKAAAQSAPVPSDPTQAFTLPQRWLRVLYRDPALLQQLCAFSYVLSSPIKCTALTATALSPTDWVTAEEAAHMQGHAGFGGLVSMGTANLFRLHHSQRSMGATVPVRFSFGGELEAATAAKNTLKVAKRHTLPPWMAPPELKAVAADPRGRSGDVGDGFSVPGKRPREEVDIEGVGAPLSAATVVSNIARATLAEKYFIVDL